MAQGSYVGIAYNGKYFCCRQAYIYIISYIKWVISNIYEIQYEIDNSEFNLLNDYKEYTKDNIPKHNDSCFILYIDNPNWKSLMTGCVTLVSEYEIKEEDDIGTIKWRDYGIRPLEVYMDWRGSLADITDYDHYTYYNTLTIQYVSPILNIAQQRFMENIGVKIKIDEPKYQTKNSDFANSNNIDNIQTSFNSNSNQITIGTLRSMTGGEMISARKIIFGGSDMSISFTPNGSLGTTNDISPSRYTINHYVSSWIPNAAASQSVSISSSDFI